MNTSSNQRILNAAGTHLFFIATAIGLIYVSTLNYIVFHLVSEFYTVIIAASMYAILWNSRQYLTNNFFLIIGIGFLFASAVDFLHALSYKGMPFFSELDANLHTQLWIAARYLQALTLVIAPVFIRRKTKIWLVMGVYSIVTLSLIFSIFSGLFPDCYMESIGFTPFKILSEYSIIFLLLISGFRLFQNKSKFDKSIFWLISGSILVTIFSELLFTLSVNVTGPYSLIGHFLKIIAFYLINLSLVKTTFENPFAVIFRDLKQKESELEDARSHYQTLFMDAPVRIFEEDFSLVKAEIDSLHSKGVKDFQAFFDTHPEAVKQCCGLVRVLSWNKEAERFFPEFSWKKNISMSELFPEIELAGINKEFIAVSKGVHNFTYETSALAPSAQVVHKLISWAVVSGHEHDFSKVIVLVQDVSEMKQMADKLRDNEERYRLLFENAGMGIGYYDLKGNILAFNEKALENMGGKLKDFIGRNVIDIYGAELGQKILDRIICAVRSVQSELYEDLAALPTGDRWYLSSYSKIMNSQSECTGVQIISQEITDRKLLEEELNQYSNGLEVLVKERTNALEAAQAQLVRQEKLTVMGQMASGVGHELRNPLAVINNALYVLRKTLKDQDDQTKTYLQIIGQEIGTADKIISDLLTFARIKPGDRKETSLSLLVEKVIERYFPPENVSVEIKLAQDLLPVMVDAGQIEQVLINLITNAYQAMPEGGKLVISGNQKKDQVSLMVEDNGIGIEKQNLEKIFEPLFTTKAKGIGLGLTVTKLLTEANEGTIKVVSEVGKRTIFTVTLPTE